MIHMEKIPGPVLEIDVNRARRNIRTMLAKAKRSGVVLRPHFKTHQSHTVAGWFREEGVDRCTVSSPAMAEYFAADGWEDILIAFPAQAGAIDTYHRLAEQSHIGLIGDSVAIIEDLKNSLETQVDFWIELDAGYGRTGASWDNTELLSELATRVETSAQLRFRGLLCHAGNSYACKGENEIKELYGQVSQRLKAALETVQSHLGRKVELSYGDTPTCSVCDDFSFMDELRPGNFVFYDLMQVKIGACQYDDIALAMACPVVGIYPDRNEVVIHGGGVHFSKESATDGSYGQVFARDGDGQQQIVNGAVLTGMSQEHGVISGPSDWIDSLQVGIVVRMYPVHSCLAVDCMLNRPQALSYVD
jgi:D-serine deaminase-like pyridoxal phosphate-dependent protein